MRKTLFNLQIFTLIIVLFTSCKTKNNKDNDNLFKYREYIAYTTSGVVSTSDPIKIVFSKDVEKLEPNSDIDKNILNISPSINGKLQLTDKRTLIFKPNQPFKPNTEYKVTLKLNKLFKTEKGFKDYTFSFKTIKQNFTITTNDSQSYSKDYQYLNGSIKLADNVSLDKVKQIIKATQKGKSLPIKWEEDVISAKNYNFKIDSIKRFEEDSKITIKWNGKPINADNIGENTINIIGKNKFSVTKISVEHAPELHLKINFSDPLKKQQNFNGLVSVEKAKNLKYIVDGNVLNVYPKNRIVGNVTVEIHRGIKSSDNHKLTKGITEIVTFEQLKPEIKLLSNGVILPDSNNLRINFKAVNLKAVDVTVIKIYEKNVLQFLQNNDLDGSNRYNIRQVGRRIAKKTIPLIKDNIQNDGKFHTYALDLSKLIKTDPGSIYRIEFTIKKAYSLYTCDGSEIVSNNEDEDYYEDDYYYDETANYTEEQAKDLDEREEQYWDKLIYSYRNNYYPWRDRNNPCKEGFYDNEDRVVAQNVLASNLGVIVKKGQNKEYHIIVNDILTTKPLANVKTTIYNYQKHEIASTKTDKEGFAVINQNKNAYFAIVTDGQSNSYIKLDEGKTLSLSKFNVSGKQIKKGLQGYIYGERGVWRPGDTLHLNFVLNDKENRLPKNHPIKLEVTDARQKLAFKQVQTNGVNGLYRFDVPTNTSAPTGNWVVTVSVGGATFTKNLKVETIKPNRLKLKIEIKDKILHANKPIEGKLIVKWLHGAPARNLKADIKVKFRSTNTAFKGFEKYVFNDPIKSFKSEELTVFDGKLDANGEATFSKKVNLKGKAPGMLKASFLSRAFEKGGDFSMDVFSKNYAPYISFVGLKSPKEHAYGSFYTNEDIPFDVVTVDDQGNPIKRNNLEVKIYQIKWRWWWSSSYDDLASYVSNSYNSLYKSFKISTDKNGKATFKVRVNEHDDYYGGRYLIRVYDPKSGHATGRTAYFYRDWWKRQSNDDPEASKMLVFTSDKDKYQVGEIAKISFPSGTEGRALLSVENGSNVLLKKWVKTKKGQTTATFQITKEMAPNVFVNISLLQPHAQVENNLPLRLYGILPIRVEDKNTILEPVIDMPNTLKPEKNFTVKVSEKSGKKMTYTIAVVDEGLLDITRFKTPNPWNEFYKKQALGVKTWDLYDYVIGAYTGSVEQVYAIGGDGEIAGKKAKKANRFKPVVMVLGPFTLDKNRSQSHTIKMPKYIGSVRTMVVAENREYAAYGAAEKATPVKKPLMVLASLPRKLSPGEKVTLPVTVFAMEKKVKNASISLRLSKGIKVIGDKTKQIHFSQPDEKMVYFNLDVSEAKGIGKIEVIAKGNGEKSSYEVEIDVVNPNPITNKAIDIILEPNQIQNVDFSTFGVKGSNFANVEFSTLPPMNFTGRLQYLIQYPHGCVEQTTSSVFPQLYLDKIFDIPVQKKQEIQDNIKAAILKLGDFQTPNGGLSYWRGLNYADDWGTSYAGHFMIEAEKKGYVLPLTFMSNWLRYQQQAAKNWRMDYRWNNSLPQAYRLYTLALAGHPDLSSMNRLREENLSNEAKLRLAAAYALAGQNEIATRLVNTANIDFKPYKYDYYTYGSVDRNRAMALETYVITNADKQKTLNLAKDIAKRLSSKNWMSTQTTAYSLYAMAKMVEKNGGKGLNVQYKINTSDKEKINTKKSVAERKLTVIDGKNTVTLMNNGNNTVFVRVLNSGILPLGEEIPVHRGLNVNVRYLDADGKKIDVTNLKQGTDFMAQVTVENATGNFVDNIALTEIFPSGWEIVNTRFTDFGNVKSSKATFTDIRDDRVNFYFDLDSRKSKTFNVLLNASYLGKYYLFGVQAEAMYDNDYLTRTKGKWIEVVKH
jgi:uncharacterized protein YfaS (alpha-2-macroglobulin family)